MNISWLNPRMHRYDSIREYIIPWTFRDNVNPLNCSMFCTEPWVHWIFFEAFGGTYIWFTVNWTFDFALPAQRLTIDLRPSSYIIKSCEQGWLNDAARIIKLSQRYQYAPDSSMMSTSYHEHIMSTSFRCLHPAHVSGAHDISGTNRATASLPH